MVKVGRTETGSSMAQSHTGHLTGSDAITAAVFRQFGVTRVDGLDELLEVSAALARTRPATASRRGRRRRREPGVCVYAISGGTGAHMADMLAAADLRLPPLAKETQTGAARRPDPRVPAGEQPGRLRRAAGRRRARPPDPRRDRRRPEDRHHRRADHRRGRHVQRAVHPRPHRRREDHRQADLRRVGRAPRHRRHVLQAPARRRAPGVPHVRQLREGRARLRRLLAVRGAATARRSTTRRSTPLPAAKKARAILETGRARRRRSRSTRRSSCSRRTASSRRRTCSCDSRRRPR